MAYPLDPKPIDSQPSHLLIAPIPTVDTNAERSVLGHGYAMH